VIDSFGLSYGPLQLRIAEALTILPFMFPWAISGVSIGCLIANVISPYGPLDWVFGTLATLLAAVLTSKSKNVWVAAIPPIIVNAAVLPFMWYLSAGDVAFFANFISILVTQSVIIFALGVPLYYAIRKTKIYKTLY
jgi:uncharacterized membrane protein